MNPIAQDDSPSGQLFSLAEYRNQSVKRKKSGTAAKTGLKSQKNESSESGRPATLFTLPTPSSSTSRSQLGENNFLKPQLNSAQHKTKPSLSPGAGQPVKFSVQTPGVKPVLEAASLPQKEDSPQPASSFTSPSKPKGKGKKAWDQEVTLSGADLKQWVDEGLVALKRVAAELDRLDCAEASFLETGSAAVKTWGVAVELLKTLPPESDRDAQLVLEQLAAGLLAGARGRIGVILAEIFQSLADASGPATLNCAHLKSAFHLLAQRVGRLAGQNAGGLLPLQELLRATLPREASLQAETTVKELLGQAWVCAQENWCEQMEVSGRKDSTSAVFLVLLAALCDLVEQISPACGQLALPSAPCTSSSVEMIKSLAGMESEMDGKPVTSRQVTREGNLEIFWQGTLSQEETLSLIQKLKDQQIQAIVTGRPDPFGIGLRKLWAASSHPRLVLETLQARSGWGVIQDRALTSGRKIQEISALTVADPWSAPVGEANVLAFQEAQYPPVSHPALITVTAAIGLVGELASLGAKVIWAPNQMPADFLTQIEEYGSGLVQLVPGNPTAQVWAAGLIGEAARRGIKLLVAPVQNELQALEVTRACLPVVSTQISPEQLLSLQRERTLQALEHFRTWEILSVQQLKTGFAYSPFEDQARILVKRDEDPQLLAQLQLELLQACPWIRIEVVKGNQGGPTVLGLRSKPAAW